jgi:hypothetical protein
MNFAQHTRAVQANIACVIIGKAKATELLLISLLMEGHVPIEDVPGISKTTPAKALPPTLAACDSPPDGTCKHAYHQAGTLPVRLADSGAAICHLPFAICHLPFAICRADLPWVRLA